MYYTIHMYSGITSGRVLNGELLYTKILEVNLFAFALAFAFAFAKAFALANANKLTSRILHVLYVLCIIMYYNCCQTTTVT